MSDKKSDIPSDFIGNQKPKNPPWMGGRRRPSPPKLSRLPDSSPDPQSDLVNRLHLPSIEKKTKWKTSGTIKEPDRDLSKLTRPLKFAPRNFDSIIREDIAAVKK